MKQTFIVNNDFVNTRLDRWLRKNISNLPQSYIEKNIRKGNIKINNKKKKSSYKLQARDRIDIYNLNFKNNSNNKIPFIYKPSKKELASTSNIFVENNNDFVVINKPSGISVQSGTKSSKNILDILRKTKEFDKLKPYPVHRIDKDTSGLLIVAKNRKYAQLFTTLFRIRKIHKIYLGVVLGNFEKKTGTYTDFLIHYEGKRKIIDKAITHYKVLDFNKNYSLLRLSPETGRKHQLRKQLLIHGHPIIGDSKYRISDNKTNKNNILMLHAYKINFSINDIKYNYQAEPPLMFKKMLNEKYLKIY